MDVTAVEQVVNVITGCINEVGFPIVLVGILLWMMWSERKAHAAEAKQHVEAVDACKTAIENNTALLTRVLDKLSGV